MNQIPEQMQLPLNEPAMLPMNPNINLINQINKSQMIGNQSNLPLNQNIPMAAPQQMPNKQQNEDTSKIYNF